MGARVIDGRGLAAELKEGLATEIADLEEDGVAPGLAVASQKKDIVRTGTIFAGRLARGKGSFDDR